MKWHFQLHNYTADSCGIEYLKLVGGVAQISLIYNRTSFFLGGSDLSSYFKKSEKWRYRHVYENAENQWLLFLLFGVQGEKKRKICNIYKWLIFVYHPNQLPKFKSEGTPTFSKIRLDAYYGCSPMDLNCIRYMGSD